MEKVFTQPTISVKALHKSQNTNHSHNFIYSVLIYRLVKIM